ncbi:hypothetical protein BH18ACT9_BH18ACT9_19970 [soil metagenome]
MPLLFDIQGGLMMLATLLLFAVQAWAFVDALSHRAEAFVAADKQTKQMWLIILGVALVAHMLIWSPFSFLNLIGAVAAIVYLVDTRPALRSLTRR